MLVRSGASDELRARLRKELPEVEQIGDAGLATRVVEAWALALASSSFGAIAEIEPSGNPGVNTLKRGTQADHIRGVTRMALAVAEQLQAQLPDLVVDRDILIAGALCHDIGKPFEFDPANRRRWAADPRAAGLPSIRHPAFGVHVCLTVGLPEEVAHCAAAHSGEGELLVRSLENTIIHHADYAFWGICRAGNPLVPESVAELSSATERSLSLKRHCARTRVSLFFECGTNGAGHAFDQRSGDPGSSAKARGAAGGGR